MTLNNDFVLQVWKRQLDSSFRLAETLIEGATKLHQMQLEAATEAHADAEATRKSIAAATDASQLLSLQAAWMRANLDKCAAYWRAMYGVAAETQTELAKSASIPLPIAGTGEASAAEPFKLIDNAYSQFLTAMQQFHKLPGFPAVPKAEPKAEARAGKRAAA
jgi:phasin family protein